MILHQFHRSINVFIYISVFMTELLLLQAEEILSIAKGKQHDDRDGIAVVY